MIAGFVLFLAIMIASLPVTNVQVLRNPAGNCSCPVPVAALLDDH
jgi:hypothetical protein